MVDVVVCFVNVLIVEVIFVIDVVCVNDLLMGIWGDVWC